MENKRRMEGKSFVWLLIVICLFISFFTSLNSISFVSAEDVVYSDVLSDLQKDESFNVDKYPVDEGDNSLKVIQIAESEDKELFVYVYQPSGETLDLRATSINISTSSEGLYFIKYVLTLIHSSGVFYKYKVENLVVSDEDKRTYNISSIFRSWDGRFDDPVGDDQSVSEVPFGVSQIWTATIVDGEVLYEREDTQTIQIESKYVGFIRYTSAFVYWLTGKACDSFFVAFSADHEIDDLYEADISYVRYTYKMTHDTGVAGGGVELPSNPYKYEYGEDVPVSDTLKYSQHVEVDVGLGITTRFEWDRIERVSDFLDEEYISEYLRESSKNNIQEKDWVLRFYESDYQIWADSIGSVVITEYETGERVKDVTILRLKFQTNGDVYNLGVVDNVQTGSDEPSNDLPSVLDDIYDILTILLSVIAIVVLLILLWPFMPTILSFLWTVVKCIFKGIWWVITAPFKVFLDDD